MHLEIEIESQSLVLSDEGGVVFSCPISSAKRGIGFVEGSYQTPTGNFVIREKIGDGAPPWTIFKSRQPIAVWTPERPEKDAVLTRILRMDGLDEENANTFDRYVYIHGTPAEHLIGQPASEGCIRLRNEDMLRLFDLVSISTTVQISVTSGTLA